MTRTFVSKAIRSAAVAALAVGAISLAGAQSAEARHGHHGRVMIHIGSGLGLGFHHRHHHSRLVLAGGGDRCGWLHRKALRTGAPYWWDRYEDCRYGY